MPVVHGDDIRGGMLAGINALANAVKVTLGPRGRNVAMPQKANLYGADYDSPVAPDAPVLVTNDGVTIAKSIELAEATGVLVRSAAMRDMDTFGVMPKPASHAVCTAELLPFLCEAYADWADMVCEGEYPEGKHGYHMDEEELKKFYELMDKFEG